MPKVVSKAQLRMMHAIAAGKSGKTARGDGGPPKSIAEKYTSNGSEKDLPDSKGKEHEGGKWTDEHKHNHSKGKSTKRKHHRKKMSKSLNKTEKDENLGSAAVLIVDNNSNILLGRHVQGGLAFPGGHISPQDMNAEAAAIREAKEETGLSVDGAQKLWGMPSKHRCQVFLADSYTGEIKNSDELKNLRWYAPHEIPWDEMRDCCVEPLEHFVRTKLGKSLKSMLALEVLEKNIVRQKGGAVHEATHGDALRLIGTGLFRKLKEEVSDMKEEDFIDVKLDTCTLKIRKHMNDVYSGNVVDGHKVVYQFTNKSLPELTAALMSVFEWYLPEDEEIFNIIDHDLDDKHIQGGIKTLIENYRKHNIGDIYEEMENIRKEIRNNVAVDLQQIEGRIMKLFDKLEGVVHTVIDKHNKLKDLTEKELEDIEKKLRELQSKLDQMGKKPETVEAITTSNKNPDKIHREEYPYLPRPQIEISSDGKIKITFDAEWTALEKENFLHDMRAKALKKGRR